MYFYNNKGVFGGIGGFGEFLVRKSDILAL